MILGAELLQDVRAFGLGDGQCFMAVGQMIPFMGMGGGSIHPEYR
jgi:hypothetical protein